MTERVKIDQSITLNKDLVNDLYLYLIFEANISKIDRIKIVIPEKIEEVTIPKEMADIGIAIEIIDALKAFKDKKGKDISEKYSIEEIAKLDKEIEKITELALFVISETGQYCDKYAKAYVKYKNSGSTHTFRNSGYLPEYQNENLAVRYDILFSREGYPTYRKSPSVRHDALWYLLYLSGFKISLDMSLNDTFDFLSEKLKNKVSVDVAKAEKLVLEYRKFFTDKV